jgi:spermidine synthase
MNTERTTSPKKAIAATCMLLSGMAALVYQIVWTHQMSVAIGTAQSAVAIMLASFLGGLALGGWIAARWLNSGLDAGKRYVFLELFIAIWAIALPFVFPALQTLLIGLLSSGSSLPPDAGLSQIGVYLIIVMAAFGPPTIAMGATLPILVRAVRGETEDVAGLYALNTFGAAAGAILAGFLLVPYVGLIAASQLGALANLAAAALAWRHLRANGSNAERIIVSGTPPITRILVAAGLSGIATFTLEVFWTRLLAVPFGGTTQGFAFMLGLWLAGLALGGVFAARKTGSAAIALTAGAVLSVVGYLAILVTGAAAKPAVLALFPSAVAFGMAYPRFVDAAGGDPAKSAALIYASNTAGAVVGSMVAGHYLLESFGFGGTLLVAVFLLFLSVSAASQNMKAVSGFTGCALAVVGAFLFGIPEPYSLLKAGVVDSDTSGDLLSLNVGRVATVEVRDRDDGIVVRSDGLPEALVPRAGMPPSLNDQHWLTVLPALARTEARSMMVIGLGGGVSLETVPSWIRRIDVVEIEERIIEANRNIASQREVNPIADPRITLVHNDARNSMLRTRKSYDIIVSQPSHPWTAGSASLYTRQFVALAKSRLADRGVFVQWMNASFVDPHLMRSFLATVASEFKVVRVYEPVPFNFIIIASDAPILPENGFRKVGSTNSDLYKRAGILSSQDFAWSLLLDEHSVRKLIEGVDLIGDDRNSMAFETGPGRGIMTRAALDAITQRPAEVRAHSAYSSLRLAQAGLLPFPRTPENSLLAAARQKGNAGDFAALAAMDQDLASLIPTEPGYASANQLRAAWRLERIGSARPGLLEVMSREALDIVDAALRVETTTDLLIQRATLAQLIGDDAMLLETALVFAQVVRQSSSSEIETRRSQALIAALQRLPSSAIQRRAISALAGTY